MEVTVGRQMEERKSDRQSLSSNNYRYCSQSRKISIGVLVDSISKAKTKDLQGPAVQTAEIGSYSKQLSAKNHEGHSPLTEKHTIVEPKDASPWVSTRSFNPRVSSSIADQDTERTPSFPATRRTLARSKLLEKASAAHSHKFFPAKSGLGSDVCRQKNNGKDICSMEAGKVDDAEWVENPVCSTEKGAQQDKEQAQGKDRTTETGGRESLRIKLWEILGDVSSPDKHLPSFQCKELHLDQERNEKQSPIEKIYLNSDTIESDSQTQISTRPMTRSLTRRKASTRKQSGKGEATEAIDRRDCQQNRKFSLKRDLSGGLYHNVVDGALPCKGEKTTEMHFESKKNQEVKHKHVEEGHQSEKSRSIPAAKKPMVHKNKVSNASSSTDRRKDVLVEPKKGTKNNSSFEFPDPLNEITDQRDIEQSMDVEASKKNLQEDISGSLLKRKRNSLQPKRDTKNNSSFEFHPNAVTDQRDVTKSTNVESSKKNMQEEISGSRLLKKRNYVQPKKHTNKNSSFESAHNVMTDQRDVEQSMDVRSLKKNLQENISGSLLLKRRNYLQPKKGIKDNSSFEFPPNALTDQRDNEPSKDVEASKKNLEENVCDSLSQKRRNSMHDPSTPPSEIKSRGSLQKSKQEQLRGQSSAEKMLNRSSIRSIKRLLSPKSADCRPDVQQEPSVSLPSFRSKFNEEDNSHYYIVDTSFSSLRNFQVARYKQNNSPKSSLLAKSNILMDEDSDNQMSRSSIGDEKDSESSDDESHKDCKESEELSPDIRISENVLQNSNKSLGNDKDAGVVGSSPPSDSAKGVDDATDLGIYMEENQEDSLTRAVALFTVALAHVKTKLKSISSRKSADILQAAVQEILLRLQNAESLIKTDMGKLTNRSHSKSKQLETRFQEKQEQLLGIHKRFKAEVEQHLHDCGSLIEDLEEHQVELKGSVEKQRAAHKKFLSQVEQEINVQLDDAERRIMAVQEVARGKMLQLKLGVAECLKHGGLS